MKILFYQRSDVIDSSGGTEKVVCFLSSELAKNRHEVVFMTNEKKVGKPFFCLSEKVKFINIGGTNFSGFRKFVFKIIKSTPLLKVLKYFDNYRYTSDTVHKIIDAENVDLIILANPSDLLELCYSNKYKAPIIQMIHNVPWNIFHRKSKRVLSTTLALMDNVAVCQILMPSYRDLMKPYYGGKIVVIPNAVPQMAEDFVPAYSNRKKEQTIINIARITPVKNQELIVKAFTKISQKYPKWNVHFWGGEDRQYGEKLKALIRENDLEGRVFLMGKTREPLEKMREADIFAFPSLFEGFPLALTEAMAVGLPCVGLRSAPSVGEIIGDGRTGLLVENDVDDFANALARLMDDAELRKKLGQGARKSMEDYGEKKIVGMWEKLIKEVTYENS